MNEANKPVHIYQENLRLATCNEIE